MSTGGIIFERHKRLLGIIMKTFKKNIFFLSLLGISTFGVALSTDAVAKPRLEVAEDRVDAAFNRHHALRKFDLDVDTVGGHLEIEGKVNTRYQRGLAYNIARRYGLGYRVTNRIRLK